MWRLAIADADLPPDEAVRMIPFPGSAERGVPWASYIEPTADPWEVCGHQFPFHAAEQEHARLGRADHQILLRVGAPWPAVLGMMRHELEHAAQRAASVWIARLNTSVTRALELHVAPLEGAFRGIYPWLPGERDANAAATRLVQRTFSSMEVRSCGPEHLALLQTPMPAGFRSGLSVRMIGVAALLPDDVAQAIMQLFNLTGDPHQALCEVINDLMPEQGLELFAALLVDPFMGKVRDAFPQTITHAFLKTSMLGSLAWSVVAESLQLAEDRAQALASSESDLRAALQLVHA